MHILSLEKEKQSWKKKYTTGIGIGVGVAIGVALGAAFHQLALWIALGVAFGGIIDVVESRRHKEK